jgi:hypothetical protein
VSAVSGCAAIVVVSPRLRRDSNTILNTGDRTEACAAVADVLKWFVIPDARGGVSDSALRRVARPPFRASS